MTTCRDVAHRRLVEEGRELPVDVRNNAISMQDRSSVHSRMTNLRWYLLDRQQVCVWKIRVRVRKRDRRTCYHRKGGMKENTERACKEFGAIHCVFPAGNAVVAATEVEEIVRAEWRDLGMPETLWNCRVKEFGPLIVSIDTEGNNWFEQQKVEFNKKKMQQQRKSASR